MKNQTLSGAAFCAALCLSGTACLRAQTPQTPQSPPKPPTFPPVKKPMKTEPPANTQLSDLHGTLKADKTQIKPGEPITFTYEVTNTGKTEQTVRFSSGQRFDIIVTQNGKTVYQMGREKMYTMSLGQIVLAPGKTQAFTETWKPDAGNIKADVSLRAEAFLTPMKTASGGETVLPHPASAVLLFGAIGSAPAKMAK